MSIIQIIGFIFKSIKFPLSVDKLVYTLILTKKTIYINKCVACLTHNPVGINK